MLFLSRQGFGNIQYMIFNPAISIQHVGEHQGGARVDALFAYRGQMPAA